VGRRSNTRLRNSVVAWNGQRNDTRRTRVLTLCRKRCQRNFTWTFTCLEPSTRLSRIACNVSLCPFTCSWAVSDALSFQPDLSTFEPWRSITKLTTWLQSIVTAVQPHKPIPCRIQPNFPEL